MSFPKTQDDPQQAHLHHRATPIVAGVCDELPIAAPIEVQESEQLDDSPPEAGSEPWLEAH